MSPELSRRIGNAFYTMRITMEEKDRVLAAAKDANYFDDLPVEIRALILKCEGR